MTDTASGTLVAKGDNGTMTFHGGAVRISRTGRRANWDHGAGEKVIPIREITGVEYQPGGLQAYGHLALTVSGGQETRRRAWRRRKSMRRDPNAVVFRGRRQREAFAQMRDAILAAMS